ncbi:MAG TPA: AMP-dependent synthetase/ligase [Bacteroidia bacterium]|nr:AMP-dependent synthetase/ligase [Bacteroidia bacterium]HRH08660.1 AMP-dependent synthetase/ligase [Bacteroidia bacterium]HRH64284.1 AMP-dependent synthetase/ligase [Bacteroidia bacterium]
MEATRLFDCPYYQLEHFPKKDALASKADGKWTCISTQEYIDLANKISLGLLELGIQPGDKIAIISNNRPEWNIMDIGIGQLGGIVCPVYPTVSENDYKFIFNDAEVRYIFVSDTEILAKVNAVKKDVPSLKGIYSFNKIDGITHWSSLLELGNKARMDEVKARMNAVAEDDLATIIYTSGTTGNPKGAMISHKNLMSNAKNCVERLPVGSDAKALSFLPLCHVYERMLTYLFQITGVSIYYAESMDTIGENIREVKPDIFAAVPRLIEKVYDRIIAKGSEQKGIKKALFFWAVSLGLRFELNGANGWWYELQLKIANKLIFTKWREALGGNVKAIASGSAPLQPRLARVFMAAKIPVMEGYGLTETAVVVSVNCEKNNGVMFGSVGRAIKSVQVKIADDGEILIKSPSVMLGYYKRPDLTAEVIDKDGWFHTGDIGEIVNTDFLKITDRKKEIFKTSGGKYVAPQLLENKFKESKFIEQVMVIGEGKNFPAALVQPAFVFLKEWCERKGIAVTSNEDMITKAEVIARIQEDIELYNQEFGKWEQVKKIELVANEWSIKSGELTPTLKLKRKFILEKYKVLVEKIYGKNS